MKIKDFEKAIDGLNCDISMDEVRLLKGQVRRFYGHKDRTLIMWDEVGRGFSFVHPNDIEVNEDTHLGVAERFYERDTVYDLKFV